MKEEEIVGEIGYEKVMKVSEEVFQKDRSLGN
jgi:predicted metal-dependent TIM-barrel fold hydrolase